MSCGDKHEQSLFGDGQPSEVPAELTHPARSRRSRRKGDLFARKQPQSQEKHEILEFYLKPWIRIISRHFGHAVYIDGFAGPGTCRTGEVCSPVLAAQTLTKYAGRGARIHLFAIEAAKQHFEALMENLDQYRSSIHIETIQDEFSAALPQVITSIRRLGNGAASLFFIDPYGYKDVRFTDIMSALKLPHSEVLVHFPYNAIIREIGVPAVHETIDHYYGQQNTADDLRKVSPLERKDLAVAKFEGGFRQCGYYTRAFEIDMPGADRPYFHIVYITKEPLGYNIMNDIWIKREKEREVNRRAGMIRLFDLEDMIATQDMLQDFLAQTFSGQTIIRKAVTAKTLMHHRSFRSDVERAIDSLVRQGRAVIQPGRRTDKDYQRLTFV